MDQKEIDLRNAAAGYPKKKRRRKPYVSIELSAEESRKVTLEACQRVLDSVGGHRAKAAKILKINERTLYKWLKEIKELEA
jgi:transcriptional regulator with PAS, ATPase and Fis domain